MKHARKLASLLLALVMVFALAVTAFASETVTPPTTGSITVDNPRAGQEYKAYKIFDVVYDAAKKHYSYTIDSTSAWFNTVDTYSKQTNSGLTLAQVGVTTYVVTTGNGFSAPDFAAALKGKLDKDPSKFTGYELTKEGKVASVSNLDLGYYFVSSGTGALCSLDTTKPDVIIHDKNNLPFEKKVNTPSADVGQTVTFTITGKVPEYTIFTDYTYEITDTMSDGLTFKKDVKVTVGGENVTTACTIVYDVNNNTNSFTVTVPVLDNKYTIGAEIKVTYSATVNEKAIAVVSENKAELTYSNNPTDSTKKTTTLPQKVDVYTSKIVIDKYEKDTDTNLEGAEFVLCRRVPDVQVAAVQHAAQHAAQYAGQYVTKYYKQDETTKAVSWVDDIADATKVTTNANGAASFDGLANGDYWLVETKAPAGYNQLDKPVLVKVNGGTTAAELSVTAKVENQAGTLLPSTGGVGTTVFYVLGAVLVLGAVVLLVTKKRMNDTNR